MKWMKERDLLIAQTMAFVQSVTGKTAEAGKTPDAGKTPESGKTPEVSKPVAAPAAPPPVETFALARPAAMVLPDIALSLTPPAAVASAVTPAPAKVQAPIMEVSAETPRAIPSPMPHLRPDLTEDFQTEIRARVARFRTHQERFSREREAYCAATMAKVHATLKEGELPPPRFVK
jgi:hypothetical protein